MSAKEGTFDLLVSLSPERERIIQRIMNLSDEQFDRLLSLYFQQETESCPACPTPHRTSA